ncbi:MAG: transglutaminase domain-containing protein [Phycisphaerales bacterium]
MERPMMHGGLARLPLISRNPILPNSVSCTLISRNLLRTVVLAAAALLLWPALSLAGDDHERWYTVEMGGQRAGYMHSVQKAEGGRITTSSRMEMKVGRGQNAVAMTMEGQFVETADHKPVSMKMVQKLGMTPKTVDYVFGEKEIAVTTRQGDQETRSTKPLPEGAWLTPAAASEYVRQRLKAGAEQIVVRTVDAMSGPEPATVTMTGIEKTTVEALGRTVPALRCTVSTSASPGVSMTEYLDEDAVPIRSQVTLGPLTLHVVVSDRETALAKADGPAPEMMVRTLVKPDAPIRRPREATRAVYLLSVPDGAMPAIPETGAQRVQTVDERTVRVTVGGPAAAAPEGDAGDAAFLASTSMVRGDDPEIVKLVGQATAKAGEVKAERAEAMRRFVRRFISTKDLDVGFATASEVARQRRGDCSEHAVLLAAMLRADGVPARVASGVLYVDEFEGAKGVFGYHMWTQALLEREGKPAWVDLDPTLPGGRAFDATHITMAVSALAEGEEARSLSAILPLMGRVVIRVESVEH